MTYHLRPLTEDEQQTITKLSQSRTVAARLVERAQMVRQASQGQTIPQIAQDLGITQATVRVWLTRFAAQGVAGLADAPRSGAPPRYGGDRKARIIAVALTPPKHLGQPFASWTFQRLATYLAEVESIPIQHSRLHELLVEEGLKWRQHETWFGARVDPDFAAKRGR